jgi:hypothetical protein
MKSLVRAGGAALLGVTLSAPVFAQTVSQNDGVFGGSSSEDRSHVSVAISEGYEGGDPTLQNDSSNLGLTGFYTSLAGELGLNRQGRRTQFGGSVGTDTRYYADQERLIGVNQYADLSLGATFARRTMLSVRQGVSYSPAYFSGLFPSLGVDVPGDISAKGGDFATSTQNALSLETTGTVTHGISRRGTLSFLSYFRRTTFDEGTGYDDLLSYSVGGRYQQQVSRYTSLKFGYAYREVQYGLQATTGTTTVHDIDLGIDYDRALSVSKRTKVDFAFGSALMRDPNLNYSQTDGVPYQFYVVGNAGLSHELSRYWHARVAYTRNVSFIEGLPEPTLTDGVTSSVNGFFGRRIDVYGKVSYSTGAVGSTFSDNDLNAYQAASRLRIALSRRWAATTEYAFYRHNIGSSVQLPIGVSAVRERHSVRVGLSMWLPLEGR